MKIAIGICEKINGICTTMGCFRAYNNKEKHFSQYKNIDTEIMSFFTCDICSKNTKENIINIAEKLKENGVDKLHLGVCIVKCEANRLDEIKEIFESKGIQIIEGTH
ncbi:CGGC domain-containing protein [Anaerosalibacter sp. Marseille-P3206]|uniref:CGGC domain-containing protein n=1 Tax=Anaerosalibacter sp. Marseille-P3206 TaxID=1871005 RepID=UPI000986EFFB|nr:CGGC domain-containing protein [Anaerosalibacter sp. Marseille-P3206]